MYNEWTKDLSWSAQVFSEQVWPILSEVLPGDIVHVERITHSDFARDLDQISGIDAWHIVNGAGIRGVASRVQVCPFPYRPYNTFTIRKSRDSGTKTEYQKRKECIESGDGWLYPHLTVQSYVSAECDGVLRSFAVALTKDIIEAIDRWESNGREQFGNVYVKRTSNASFYVVKWDRIARHIHIAGEKTREIGQLRLFAPIEAI